MTIYTGTAGNDTLNGGPDDDVIDGGDGDDVLYGYGGNDILLGGAGYDTLYGGLGNDTLDGGASGADSVDYSDSTDPVTVDLAHGTAVGIGIGTDTLIGIEYVYGSGYDDTLIGDANANVLTGGLGNDTLTGNAGSDWFRCWYYSSDTSTDTVTDFSPGVGGDNLWIQTKQLTNYDSFQNPFVTGHARLTQSGKDTLFEIDTDGPTGPISFQTIAILQNVTKTSLVAANLTGWDPNEIDGTAGDDSLTGTADNDSIYGFAGNDTINGMAGNDTLFGGSGDDRLDGGDGADYASYSDAAIPVTVNLSLGSAVGSVTSGSGIGTDVLINIENIIGSRYADTLIGDTNDNVLLGGLGDDTLTGGAGSDVFVFGTVGADYSIDTITDFRPGAGGDRMSAPTSRLTNYTPGDNPFASGHARLIQQGADTWLKVDIDGPAGPISSISAGSTKQEWQ